MDRFVCCRMAVAMGLIALVTLVNDSWAVAVPATTIDGSGKTLRSVFEGLTPNPQLANHQSQRQLWRGMLQSRLPGLLRVSFTEGAYCPTSTCEGNYEEFVDDPGGCTSSGCPNVQDFITDTTNGSCYQGAMDVECGGGDAGPCCANWNECPATNTIGCPAN
jgi:hypothetical protein